MMRKGYYGRLKNNFVYTRVMENRSEIVESVARQSEGYIFAGNSIGKLGEPIGFFEAEIYGYDEHLAEALRLQEW